MISERSGNQNKILENGVELGELVGYGVDSEVFKSRDGAFVVKLYTQGQWLTDLDYSRSHLDFYKTITNQARVLVKNDQKKWKLKIHDGRVVPIEINSIEDIFISNRCQSVVGISRHVGGSNLSGFNRTPNFDIALYSTLWGELDKLSYKLNSALGTYGIALSELNVKITYEKERCKIVVTDLCPSIASLRKLHNHGNI